MKFPYRYLLLRSLLFAILLNAASLYELARYGRFSPVFFRDGDEAGYLASAIASAEGRTFDQMYYYEHRDEISMGNVLFRIPNGVTEAAAGLFGKALGMTPSELGVALDLVCAMFSYFGFALFLGIFVKRPFAEFSTIVLLAFPWVFAVNNYFHYELSWWPNLEGMSFSSHTVVPALRSVHTQLSYPLLAWSFILAAQWFLAPRPSLIKAIATSAAIAGLLYFYFFSWIVAATVIGIWGLLNLSLPAYQDKQRIGPKSVTELVLVTVIHLLLISPALYIITRIRTEMSGITGMQELLANRWYLPLPNVVIIFALLYLVIRRRGSAQNQQLLRLLTATNLAEIVLMNLQPLIHLPLIPFHFTLFYLTPLQAGLFIALVSSVSFKKLSSEMYFGCLLVVIIAGAKELHFSTAFHWRNDTIELARYLADRRAESPVIAMMPFDNPFSEKTLEYHFRSRPTEISALSGNNLLYQHWFPQYIPIDEFAERELLLGWIFSGKPSTIRSCEFDSSKLNKNAWFQNWVTMQLYRKQVCGVAEQIQATTDICALLRKYRVDYAIWEPIGQSIRPPFASEYFSEEWKSASGEYVLFRLDQHRAIDSLCAKHSDELPRAGLRE